MGGTESRAPTDCGKSPNKLLADSLASSSRVSSRWSLNSSNLLRSGYREWRKTNGKRKMLGPKGEESNRPTAGTGASRKKANIAPAGNQEAEADISKEETRKESEAMRTEEGNASEKGATVIMTIDAVLSGIKRRLAKRSQTRERNDGREAK